MENCIFCQIIAKKSPSEMYYEDDEMVVFKDIKPASTHHYLAVSKEHIKSAKELTLENKQLLEHLIANGKKVLQERGGNVDDVNMGFHWPPFYSVGHLHLHLISPVANMGFLNRHIYKPDSFWFVSPDYVMNHLKPKM